VNEHSTRPAIRVQGLPATLAYATAVAVACLVTFEITIHLLTRVHSGSYADKELGGMWATIATLFVFREAYHQSVAAALSRTRATVVSFALCLLYLAFLPFHPWGMMLLIGVGAVIVTMTGHPEDVITTGITTVVVMVVAGLSPHEAWQQPILRLADTVVGVLVGVLAATCTGHVAGHRSRSARRHRPASSLSGGDGLRL
jgi:Fusaric acid resistance protein-like